jgi:NADH:ubiquinone oxidoreductase subunit 3 (subunit A)
MYEDWTRNQKLRWLCGWLAVALCFVIFQPLTYFILQFLVGDRQLKVMLGVAIDLPIALVLAGIIYRQVIVYWFPETDTDEK